VLLTTHTCPHCVSTTLLSHMGNTIDVKVVCRRVIYHVEYFPHLKHRLPLFDDMHMSRSCQLEKQARCSHHVSVVMSSSPQCNKVGAVESHDKWATFPHRFPQLLILRSDRQKGDREVLGLHPHHFAPVPWKRAETGGGVVEGGRRPRRWWRRLWRGRRQCQR